MEENLKLQVPDYTKGQLSKTTATITTNKCGSTAKHQKSMATYGAAPRQRKLPATDKYSILDGSFPREERSFVASKIMQDIRLKQVNAYTVMRTCSPCPISCFNPVESFFEHVMNSYLHVIKFDCLFLQML